jgi:hypothetical protein
MNLLYNNVYVMNVLTIMFTGHEFTYINVYRPWIENTAMARNSDKFTANHL